MLKALPATQWFCDFIVHKSIIFFSVEHCGYFQSCALRNNTKRNLYLEMSCPPLHSPVLGQVLSDLTTSPALWEIFWRACLLMAICWFAVDSWKPKWEVGKRQGWQGFEVPSSSCFLRTVAIRFHTAEHAATGTRCLRQTVLITQWSIRHEEWWYSHVVPAPGG